VESKNIKISLGVILHDKRGNNHTMAIKDIDDDLESLYQERSKSVFSFALELNSPEEKRQVVQVF